MKLKFENKFENIIKELFYKKYNFNEELNIFHKILDSNKYFEEIKNDIIKIKELGKDRKSIFINDYHEYIDNNNSFKKIYYEFIEKNIKPLYGVNKIIIQKTPNLRISFPNSTAIGKNNNEDEKGIVIGIHKDSDFGHNEDEINIIIPITKMFETNSIYYEPSTESKISTDNYINLILEKDEFFIVKFNNLLHFNKINKTGFTRISLDIRIIPYEKYMNNLYYYKNTKFELGKYYIIL